MLRAIPRTVTGRDAAGDPLCWSSTFRLSSVLGAESRIPDTLKRELQRRRELQPRRDDPLCWSSLFGLPSFAARADAVHTLTCSCRPDL